MLFLRIFSIIISLCIRLIFAVGGDQIENIFSDKTPDDKNAIDPNTCDHEWLDWNMPYGNWCHENIITLTCSKCNYVETRQGTEEDHNIIESFVQEPDCASDGYKMSTCTRCGFTRITEILPKSGEHDFSGHITVQPTCFSEGYIITQCTVCGWSEITETLPKLDHELVDKKDDAEHWQRCTECHEKFNVEKHSWNDEYICTVCGYKN